MPYACEGEPNFSYRREVMERYKKKLMSKGVIDGSSKMLKLMCKKRMQLF